MPFLRYKTITYSSVDFILRYRTVILLFICLFLYVTDQSLFSLIDSLFTLLNTHFILLLPSFSRYGAVTLLFVWLGFVFKVTEQSLYSPLAWYNFYSPFDSFINSQFTLDCYLRYRTVSKAEKGLWEATERNHQTLWHGTN